MPPSASEYEFGLWGGWCHHVNAAVSENMRLLLQIWVKKWKDSEWSPSYLVSSRGVQLVELDRESVPVHLVALVRGAPCRRNGRMDAQQEQPLLVSGIGICKHFRRPPPDMSEIMLEFNNLLM